MGHAHTPPELPEITDEAGDSPTWLPLLGVLLFALGIGSVVYCHMTCTETETDTSEEAAVP